MSLADTCGTAVVQRCYSRYHFYQRNTCIPFTLLSGFLPQEMSFVRLCNSDRRVFPCPSVVQSYSVSAFVPWCYSGVTRIKLRERIRRTTAGDAVHAQVFVLTWFASWYVPLQWRTSLVPMLI